MRPAPAATAHAGLGLRQVAAHCWMLRPNTLFCSVLSAPPGGPGPGGGEQVGCPPAPSLTPPLQSAARKLAESWLPALLDDAEPRENSEPPRPLLQLRHPQQQGTSESASCPGTKPWEACLRQGVGSARLRLQAEMWPAGVWVLAGGHDHCAPCPPSAVCWGTTWSNEGGRETKAKHLFCGDRGVPSLCQKRAAGLGVLSPHTRK